MQEYNAWTERYNAFMLATEGGTFWACLDCNKVFQSAERADRHLERPDSKTSAWHMVVESGVLASTGKANATRYFMAGQVAQLSQDFVAES